MVTSHRLLSFLALECPLLLPAAREILKSGRPASWERALCSRLEHLTTLPDAGALGPLYPGMTPEQAVNGYRESVEESIHGFFRREEIRDGITTEEKIQLYRWMVLTRTLDTRLKELFDQKDVLWNGYPSPMKGFRSWGQEAIAGVPLRLRHGEEYGIGPDYTGDILGPMIRDLGAMLAWNGDVETTLAAQAGKRGSPMEGRDLHTGNLDTGVLPPTAPLAISTQTLIGMAYSFKLDKSDRICLSLTGEGGSSLGEWHEAINFAAVQRIPLVIVAEDNKYAYSTPIAKQMKITRIDPPRVFSVGSGGRNRAGGEHTDQRKNLP